MLIEMKTQIRQVFKTACWSLVDGLVRLTPAETDSGNVLLVRADAIGDFVMWLQEARHLVLHLRQGGAKITLVAGSAWAAWAEEMQIANRVIAFDRARFDRDLVYRFRLGRQVRDLGCGIAIQPTYARISHSGDAIVRVSGARECIGSVGDPDSDLPSRRRRSNQWYTRLIPALDGPVWEAEQNVHFLRQYLDADYVPTRADLRIFGFAGSLPSGFGVEAGDAPFYVLFPGASEAGKRWPIDSFREIAVRLHAMTGWHGIVCGGPEDADLAAALVAASTAPLSNWAGRTSLAEMSAVLARARLLLSNDTSASHIAAAVRLPSVCVLGGGHFGRFHPYPRGPAGEPTDPVAVYHTMNCYQCSWRCIYTVLSEAPKPCIAKIGVEGVWNAVRAIVSKEPLPHDVSVRERTLTKLENAK